MISVKQSELYIKQVECDNLIYAINEEENIASIIGFNNQKSDLLIPRTIQYEQQEYLVTRISTNAFKNYRSYSKFELASNSAIQEIEKKYNYS